MSKKLVFADFSRSSKSHLRVVPGFVTPRSKVEQVFLTRRLLHAQEDERRNVARELHDGLNQSLAMLGVEVGIVLSQLPPSSQSLRRQLNRIRTRVEQLSEEVRQISHRLHPAALDHLGLVSALRSYCSEFEEYRHVDVLFVCEGSVEQVPSEVAVCLYRIVQEALCNASKHANANEIVVNLTLSDREITLAITDDGRGFDVIQPGQKMGLGLLSMEERARMIGGRFSIDSHIGSGTRIEIVIPGKEASKWKLLSETKPLDN